MGIVLIGIGLVLGPAYYISSRFFSGGVVVSLPIEMKRQFAVSEGQSSKGAVLRASKPVAMRLNSEMNPVRLILKLRCDWDTLLVGPVRNRYRATLLLSDAVISERFLEVVAAGPDPGSQVYREVLATLAVQTSGGYTLSLEETVVPEMAASDFQIEVRRNVRHPDMQIVVAGVLMFCVGVVALLL